MNAKQMAALCSMLGLMLSGAAYADSGAMTGMDQKSSMPMFEQGSPIMDDQVMSDTQNGKMMVPAGINHPGRINPSGSNDFFVTGSFIYWMASTDGLNVNDFAYDFASYPAGSVVGQTTPSPIGLVATGGGREVFVKPKYKPGFKVGLGYNSNFDDWTAYLEYTWLHQTDHSSFSANSNDGDNDADDTTDHVFLLAGAPYNIASDLLSTKWRLDLDVLDFTLSRAYYVGKRVIVEPFGGLRAAWIRQHLHVGLSSSSPTTAWAQNPLVTDELSASAKCNSWGLGARLGMHSEWLLGMGFRFDAKASASLLFTRYSNLSSSSVGDISSTSLSYRSHYDVMRANAEMGLGLGWGSYFGSDDGYHFDLVATYDFNIWWSQNMLRGLFDTGRLQSGNNPTDLMYHGPTVTLRLDF
jgi:hypothetical protein